MLHCTIFQNQPPKNVLQKCEGFKKFLISKMVSIYPFSYQHLDSFYYILLQTLNISLFHLCNAPKIFFPAMPRPGKARGE